jgi:hypothetical protein
MYIYNQLHILKTVQDYKISFQKLKSHDRDDNTPNFFWEIAGAKISF